MIKIHKNQLINKNLKLARDIHKNYSLLHLALTDNLSTFIVNEYGSPDGPSQSNPMNPQTTQPTSKKQAHSKYQ